MLYTPFEISLTFLYILPPPKLRESLQHSLSYLIYAFTFDIFLICSLTYSSINNLLSPIYVSDWLIFCVKIWCFFKKEKWKWQKPKYFDEKQLQKMPQKYLCNHQVAFFITNTSYWPVMQHAPKLRDAEKM